MSAISKKCFHNKKNNILNYFTINEIILTFRDGPEFLDVDGTGEDRLSSFWLSYRPMEMECVQRRNFVFKLQ